MLDLGLRRGLDHVPIADITDRAGVSRRTFFNYFDTKEDAALIELFAFTETEIADLARDDASTSAWDALTALFLADLARRAEQMPDLPRYLELHAGHPVVQSRQLGRFVAVSDAVSAAVQARLGGDAESSGLRAELMVQSCIAAVRSGLHRWARAGSDGALGDAVAPALDVFEPAFRTSTSGAGS